VMNLKCSMNIQTSTDTDVRRPKRDKREVQPWGRNCLRFTREKRLAEARF
jgi:hypothetical protein